MPTDREHETGFRLASDLPKRKFTLFLAAGLMVALLVLQKPVVQPAVVSLAAGSTSVEIQKALDSLPKTGGEVVLAAGIFAVTQPIVRSQYVV